MTRLPVPTALAPDSDKLGDMGTSTLPGRTVLDIGIVRELSHRSDARGALRFAVHVACLAGTGALIWLAQPWWYLLIAAMTLHGFVIVTMFAPMHECVHRTAFKTRRLNEVFGWLAGVVCFYNSTYFRRYHTWHHRYTQDAARDPELMAPKPRTALQYALHISGLPFWLGKPRELALIATGRMQGFPFIPPDARLTTAISAAAQVAMYVVAIGGSLAVHSTLVWYYWLFPAILAQPLLRAILIVEHTGCSQDANGLTNTRTTLTTWPVRLLMWNMPFHSEHHLYPSIPFHQLPHAHDHLRAKLTCVAPSYVAANRNVIDSVRSSGPPERA